MKQFDRSANGKYIYPVCSISGVRTFANKDYFQKTLDKKFGGSEERMIKEFIVREARKYLEAGYKPEQIREIAIKNKGKLPKINVKPKANPKNPKIKKERKKRLKSFAVDTVTVMQADQSGSLVEVKKPVYPWSANPTTYFLDTPKPLSVEETSKEGCLYPPRFLDDKCHGCPVYDRCTWEKKYEPGAHLKKGKKSELVVKKLDSFSEEEIAAAK